MKNIIPDSVMESVDAVAAKSLQFMENSYAGESMVAEEKASYPTNVLRLDLGFQSLQEADSRMESEGEVAGTSLHYRDGSDSGKGMRGDKGLSHPSSVLRLDSGFHSLHELDFEAVGGDSAPGNNGTSLRVDDVDIDEQTNKNLDSGISMETDVDCQETSVFESLKRTLDDELLPENVIQVCCLIYRFANMKDLQ